MTAVIISCIVCILFTINNIVNAACPNGCSGHGNCNSTGICNCYSGWNAVADCSLQSL